VTAGSDETAPAKPRRGIGTVPYWILIVLMAILLVYGALTLLRPEMSASTTPIPPASPTTVPTLAGDAFVSARHPIGSGGGHRVSGLGLIGAVYPDAVVDGQSMTLPGVPFTFIVPSAWQCGATTVVGVTAAFRCAPGDGGPQLTLYLRHCPTTCADADRVALEDHLQIPPRLSAIDAYTHAGDQTVDGRYSITLLDTFTVTAAEPLRWLVVAQADASPADAATVQRVINDIYAQTRG
jgi:hypothetical protein